MPKREVLKEQFSWYESGLSRTERKRRGHYSTPPVLVEQILDACGYTPEAGLRSIRVLDPACGSGNFLATAARRLLDFSVHQQLAQEELITLLQRNLWGFDPDPIACFLAEMQLRTILGPAQDTRLHIHQADGLTLPWEPCVDLLLTNPPYLAAKNSDLSGYQFAQQRGQADSYLLFLNLAFSIVRPGGWIGLVLPDPLLARTNAVQERRRLLEEFTLHHLWHLSAVFAAHVGAVVLIAQKCPPQQGHQVSWVRERWRDESLKSTGNVTTVDNHCYIVRQSQAKTIPQQLFLRQPSAELRYLLAEVQGTTIERLGAHLAETSASHPWFAPLSKFLSIHRGEELGRDSSLLSRGDSCSPFKDRYLEAVSGAVEDRRGGGGVDVGRGPLWPPAVLAMSPTLPQAGGHKGPLPAPHHSRPYGNDVPLQLPPLESPCGRPAEWLPVLRGGLDIQPFASPRANWWIAREGIKKPLERYQSAKLLVVKSTDRLQATLDMQGHVVLQTLYLLHLQNKDAHEDELYFFLALLNSRLLRRYVYILHTAYKWVQPQIEQHVLARLPIPLVASDRRERIIELSKLLVNACSKGDPVVEWKEQITRMYEELESAIGALYEAALNQSGPYIDKGAKVYG